MGRVRENKMNKKEINLLVLVPQRKQTFVRRDDGTVEVIVPRYGGSRVGKILETVIKSKPIRIKLDAVGAFTWNLCDGNNSVQAIGERLKDRFGDKVEPLYDRLAVFFKQMEKRDLIGWKHHS
jgi:hypothetical protein